MRAREYEKVRKVRSEETVYYRSLIRPVHHLDEEVGTDEPKMDRGPSIETDGMGFRQTKD